MQSITNLSTFTSWIINFSAMNKWNNQPYSIQEHAIFPYRKAKVIHNNNINQREKEKKKNS